jgi:HEAT repeat protein
VPDPATIDRLFARASSDESALNNLVGIGEPALKWLLQNRLSGASAGQVGVLATLMKVVKADQPLLIEKISSPSDPEAATALRVAAAAAVPGVDAAVIDALKRPALERDAADAAGVLNVPGAAPALMGLAASEDKGLALRAMVALVRIGDPSTAGTAQALLDSTDLPLRKAALELAAKFPPSGMPVAKAMLNDPGERRARIGIELLAAIGSPDALVAIGPYLAGGQAGIRISALCALNGRCPAEFRQRFLALRTDGSPLVRAVARQSDPGR